MALAQLMRDTLSLVKLDGSRTDGIKGSVQNDKIFIHRSDIAIEEGDLLIRSMPHGGVEEYVVIEPNFRQGLGSIPPGYQAEVRRKPKGTNVQETLSTPVRVPEAVISLVQSFISLCITVVNDDASKPEKHIATYHSLRMQILELSNVMTIPVWIQYSQTPANVKNSVGLHVQGGDGGWERRRQYLQSEMNKMLESYKNITPGEHSLSANSIKTTEQTSGLTSMASDAAINMKKKVFIVHGHDDNLKNEVFIFLTKEGFEPVILHHEASEGQTIIEKLEKHISSASFAVVLYTACDQGKARNETELKGRARQNVVFEHGWLISKLSRKYVAAIVEDGVEFPGDLSGLIRIPKSDWKYDLSKELKVLK
ncbi:Predicted nucleotide-binding protein containing TIR-like domain [Citrobacter amalonaticus]|uniref:TIR domain-containing protein n=1 Tax=Enterobacteriaceae TaxID=543 RepID=UPI000E18D43A|nr:MULTISPECIES: nucleotide-binding protein [Enterobacteriaceae]EIQ7172936.1 nucleotide-binding protein [Escherichia coli]EIQ9903865.1 nucleotide-binding protein [Escherichia coli]QFH87872.1 nucleotide-binding containing TIR-like domain protein [Enterobacter hormaechei]UBI22944.1 nucleotide-binding protein [Citrobacter amalonaticus]STA62973.1 Predicted nucleotide-binding protein containing TIR-like domain [Citrobacter amalonaticus]